MVKAIIRREISRWFRFWSQKIFCLRIEEKNALKIFRGRIQKEIAWFESGDFSEIRSFRIFSELSLRSTITLKT